MISVFLKKFISLVLVFFLGYASVALVLHLKNKHYEDRNLDIKNNEFSIEYDTTSYLGGYSRNNCLIDSQMNVSICNFSLVNIGRRSLLTTPIESKDSYFFGDGQFIRSVSKSTLEEGWSIKTNAKVAGTPSLKDNFVYASNELGEIYCVEEQTGNVNWIVNLPKGSYGSPLIIDNKLIIGCWDKFVYCFDTLTLEVLWKFKTGAPINSTGALKHDKVFICSDKLYCLNLNNGKLIWSIQSKKWNMIGSPTILGDFVIVGMSPRSSVLIGIDSGKKYWEAPIGDNVTSLAACPTLIVGSNCFGELFALDHYGKLNWKILLSTKTSSSPLILNDKVFVGDDNGYVYEVELKTGMLIKKMFTDSGEIETAGIFSNKIIFATTSGKYIFIDIEK